jgi:dipeptidyl aminopeptidase/acylaminoacyl peptidase
VSAKRISTPILLQLADDEYLDALESYTALKEAGAPVDMYVFPGEHHVKWQPAHRLAIYRRSLDWFDYWLKGVRSADPARKSELQQWDRLKGEHGFPVKP